jgi:enolase-phosphatase E1
MIQAIVTDIEGTTSSLSFVKEVLFPYAYQQLPAFVQQHADDPAVQTLLQAVCDEVGAALTQDQVIDQLLDWIARDQKITPLKALQGLIWEAGYQQGAFSGHLYDDAVRQLTAWKQQGLQLYVYSSGSVQAQKLLFGHTQWGDLTPLFSGYFDTHIGGKREQASYQRIAEHIALPPPAILFLSDISEELDAAQQAGFNTYWLVRDQVVTSDASHRQALNFDGILL